MGVLPNPQDQLGARYIPIRAAICAAMNAEPLTPTHAKGHAPARNLVQAKLALKKLLTHDDIEFLIDHKNEPPLWAVGRALQGTPVERFMNGLAIKDWDVKAFVVQISKKTTDGGWPGISVEFLQWLTGKNVEWHQQLYALLAKDNDAQEMLLHLKRCRIVRLADGGYSVGSKCHFPNDNASKCLTRNSIPKKVG